MKAGYLITLAAVACASVKDSGNKIERRESISQEAYENLGFYAQHAAAAYCNADRERQQPLQCNGNCPALEDGGLTVFSSFSGSSSGIAGYVTVDHDRQEIVVSVRGSNNIRNFITSLVFTLRDCDLVARCQIHAGFAQAWDEIARSVTGAVASARRSYSGYRIVITGHSLGGAVATIAAAYLSRRGFIAEVYTYGSPRVGNNDFVSFINTSGVRQWRVTHHDDPVPRLPPISFGYRHVSPEFWLANGNAEQNNYAAKDIRVCYGTTNVDCNASTLGFNIDSHFHYLREIAACAPSAFHWKRRDDQDISNEELEQRLSQWSQLDVDYVKNTRYYHYDVVD